LEKIIEKIKNSNSRINSYVILGEINSGKTRELLKIKDIKYIDFLEEAQEFFDKEMLDLRLFEIGIFFKYIEKITKHHRGVTVIDNLEFIQNILYNLEEDEKALKRFFNSMIRQSFFGKIVFVISNIKRMKTEYILEKSELPETNIVIWRETNVN